MTKDLNDVQRQLHKEEVKRQRLLITRRALLAGAAAIPAVAATDIGQKYISFGFEWIVNNIHKFQVVNKSQRELLRGILGLENKEFTTDFGAPFFYEKIYTGGPHPDNAAGGSAIYGALIDETEKVVHSGSHPVALDINGNVLAAAGPIGSDLTRIAFEFEGKLGAYTRRSKPIVGLKWTGMADVTAAERAGLSASRAAPMGRSCRATTSRHPER